MKMLIISNLFHPDRGGGASVFSDFCFGLAERGFGVTVYTTYPYYPEWKNKTGKNLIKVAKETQRGVDIERYGIYIPKEPSKLSQRVLYEVSFLLSLFRSLRKGDKFDMVMAYCPLLSSVIFAALRKRLYKSPLWINIQDIPADAADTSGISNSRLFNYFGAALQHYVFNQGDIISTISPVMMKRIETLLCNRRKHICYLPNWLNDSLREEIDALPNKHKKRTASPVRLLYAGNIGKKQDLLKFCRFMHRQDFDFEFCIYGAGGEANHVDEWVSSVRDPRFSYGPFLDEAGFAEALNYTDFFVITEKKGIGASFIPSKLIPAIYSGTPILAVCDCDSPLGQEMSAFKLGCQFPWDNLDGLIPNFVKYIKNPRKFLEARQNCVSRSMFFKRDRVIDSFLESLNSNFSIPFP